MYQRALPHREPSLAGHTVRFSSLVAAPAMGVLSGIEGSALCGAAFSQVARERQGPRDAFLATPFQAVQADQVTLLPVRNFRTAIRCVTLTVLPA